MWIIFIVLINYLGFFGLFVFLIKGIIWIDLYVRKIILIIVWRTDLEGEKLGVGGLRWWGK